MTAQFDTDAGVAAWIRKQVTELANTDTYPLDPDGDGDIIHDFQLVISEYTRAIERAVLARIKAANVAKTNAANDEA